MGNNLTIKFKKNQLFYVRDGLLFKVFDLDGKVIGYFDTEAVAKFIIEEFNPEKKIDIDE